ncbi:hypothetical protein HRG84_01480 [Flavisolibacter sp. BT320]|nr:hypothetical protein [Flavisolibacter longurius]
MKPGKSLLLLLPLFLLCSQAVAQREQAFAGQHLSKKDLGEFLLYKSKREKTKAIVTVVAGPVLTGIGIYLYKKPNEPLPVGPGMDEKRSPTRVIGILMASLGITTTVCSIPLFVSAASLKREARLVLTEPPTAFGNNGIPLPGLGLQVNF